MFSIPLTRDMLEAAYKKAYKIININALKFSENFPYMMTESDGRYSKGTNDDMGSGFWTGIYILAYEMTGEKRYLFLVSRYLDKLYSRFFKCDIKSLTEMGFLYVPSCVLANKIIKNERARTAVVMAADVLNSMYQVRDDIYFVNYNYMTPGKDELRPIKISAMLNCSVLYWACDFTGFDVYKKVADGVISFIENNLIGDDGTAYWEFDMEKGPIREGTVDGRNCRAVSWGLYGLAIKYRRSKDEKVYRKIVKLLEKYTPQITQADLYSMDSTMLACFMCAIYDIAESAAEDFKKYVDFADTLLANLIDKLSLEPLRKTDGILGNSTGFYSTGAPVRVPNRNVSTVIGDYFYMEALVRKLKDFKSYF